jgi:hypothetical protein
MNNSNVSYMNRNGFGVSQLGSLGDVIDPSASSPLAAPDSPVVQQGSPGTGQGVFVGPTHDRIHTSAQSLVNDAPVVFGLMWTAPAALGGAVSGLVAASTMRGAQQGALWAGGGAAAVAGSVMLMSSRKAEGWGFLLGGLSLAGYAVWRASKKSRD